MKKIINILMVFVLVFSCFSITTFASETDVAQTTVKSGDFVYMVLPDGTAEILGYTGTQQYLTIPPIIDGYLVTSIGREAFGYNLYPEPLMKSIAQTGESLYVSLVEVEIPPTVKNIGESAFFYCKNLSKITIPFSVTTIGSKAFDETPWLESKPDGCVYINNVLYCYKGEMPEDTHIDVKDGTTQICGHAFFDYTNLSSVTIPDSVTDIGEFAFYGCSGLTKVTIPDSVTSIGDYAFCDCLGLDKALIPDSVTSLGEYAFYGCTGITQLQIPSSITEIRTSTFGFCESLSEVVIPDSVTKIGPAAFKYCKNLSSIIIPTSLTDIVGEVFGGTQWYKNQPDGCVYINTTLYKYKGSMPQDTKIIVKDGTTDICAEAFYSQENLVEVEIPSSVTTIGAHAFRYCDNLKSVRVEDSVKSLGIYAFSEGITIYGDAGSAAQEYSKTPRFKAAFVLIGDVDNNSSISITDATEIQRIIAQLSGVKDFHVADFDGDGDITIMDATAIQKMLVKIE